MPATPARPTPKDKKRRRRRRIISLLVYVVIVLALSWFFESQATTTIIFVRHAETEAGVAGADPPLSTRGVARANLLADFLADVDVLASVDAIYASEFRRTQHTASPLAKRLGLEVAVADQYEIVDFMTRVQREHKGKIVLIVTHEEVIAPLVAELHGHQSVPEIAPDDYDDLYVVTIPWFGKVKTLRLHYAVGWSPAYSPATG